MIQGFSSNVSFSLQQAINAAIASNKALILESGVYAINQTVNVTQTAGFKILGAGNYDPTNTGPGWSDRKRAIGTKFLWTGPHGGTMFNLNGSMGTIFAGCVIDGGGTATGIGGIDAPIDWAFSRLKLERVAVQNCSTGVQFGVLNGNNCDLSLFDDVRFQDCGIGVNVLNAQSVGHVWQNITHNSPGVCIQMTQGGQITLRNINQDGPNAGTFLKLLAGGPNVATVSIDGGHVESGTLIDASQAPEWCNWKVRVRSVLATVQGGAGSGYTSSPLISASQYPVIDCQDCDFNGRLIQAGPNVTVR